MTREEAMEAIKEAYGNSEYTDEIIKALEQEPILDKIIEDIQTLRGCSCWDSDGIIDDVEDIIDKYKAESEV